MRVYGAFETISGVAVLVVQGMITANILMKEMSLIYQARRMDMQECN